ncbi:sensor histidine kinase [Streptomyces geranii]|uniref:sensor histidine kinase n=1 Tax=Streptomyces geranii TaxID=2058923 RepID=UPI000D0417B1|nr:histidine kinase [Streptomyces geranii]
MSADHLRAVPDDHAGSGLDGPTRGRGALSPVAGVIGLAGLVYGAVSATDAGLGGRDPVGLVLTVGVGLGFAGWLFSRHTGRAALALGAVLLLAVSGGAIMAFSGFGAVAVGVAGLCAATRGELRGAVLLAGAGVVAAWVALAVTGHGFVGVAAAAAGALVGLLLGISRRQQQARERADAELVLERERGVVEHERAELLAERNRIAREVHDVLAHTLSALSVQMTALDSLVEAGAEAADIRAAIGRNRRLVVEGLEETRRAVQALRDQPVALDDQLSALTAAQGATLRTSGPTRSLPPAAGVALLRVAQESLTNARKHAPGARVTVDLTYGEGHTTLTVTNTTSPGPGPGQDRPTELASTGSGYGLHSMRERVELAGGTFGAGPEGEGWRVGAEVPG